MSGKVQPILLVDDDEETRSLLREGLEGGGLPIVEAANGRAALEFLVANDTSEPCVIVLDLQMPRMSGWEFLAIVKNYMRLASIPVIVLSGSEPHPETLSTGTIAAWVQKPCDARDLIALIKTHARRRDGD